MGIKRVRTELKNAVGGMGIQAGGLELTCYDYEPDSVETPCFYTGEVEDLQPNVDFSGLTDTYTIVCRVLTSRNDAIAGQKALDDLLDRGFIRKAIVAARGTPGEFALNGACDDLKITSISGYRGYLVGTDAYYGAEIRVFIIGAGDGE